MSLIAYMRTHFLSIISLCFAVLLPFLLLRQMGLDRDPALLIVICIAFFCLIAGLSNYLQKKRFSDELTRLVSGDIDVLVSAMQVSRPSFAEDEVGWEAIRSVAQEARRVLGDERAQAAAYREYVETWVHEIKTPLAAQRLMLENMHDPKLGPYAQELSRVEEYVEQALYFARSSSLENDYLIRSCLLSELVKTAVKSHARSLIACGMRINLNDLADSVIEVPCDPKWMVFILGQLIDNAIRYRIDPIVAKRTPQLSFSAQTFGVDTSAEKVELSIQDNGSGISPADIARVFERGFTGDNGRQRMRSTGLGLYLAQTLCKKMGLDIRAESQQGAWTTIIISFPRRGINEYL